MSSEAKPLRRMWSLGQLTVVGVRPSELVEIAARAGYDAVDPIVGLIEFEGIPVVPLKAGDADTIEFARALKANGILFNTADGFILHEATDLEQIRRAADLVAELGARYINAILFDHDEARSVANLAALSDMAAVLGMTVLVEFMPLSTITPDLRTAMDIVAKTGNPDIRVMVDALHAAKAGVSAADVLQFGATVGGAQFCDAVANLTDEQYRHMAIYERLAPGDGELPLREFMAALPSDMICSIEVPRLDEPDLVGRAARMLRAGQGLERIP